MIIALKLDRITRSTRDWETLMDYLEKYNINHEIEDSIKELLSDIFEYDSVVNEFFLPVLQNKIDNYFNKIANDTKHDLACEIVIELGNMEYWDEKSLEYKYGMTQVFEQQLEDIQEIVPDFYIANATIHFDEHSPHMHIVGVPVKDGCKTGLSKQVNKSSVFTKERLEHIQNVMREKCIDTFNKYFEKENATLKTKERGRNKDIHVKDMVNYQELKKELEINKRSIDKNNEKIKSINNSSKELKNLLSCLEESRLGGYKLNNKQKERLQDLIKDVESITDYFDNYKNIINNISSINDNLKYQKDRNNKVENDNNKLIKENQKLKMRNTELKEDRDFVHAVMDKRMDERKDFIAYLCKNANSKDLTTSRFFRQVVNDMNSKNLITDKEHRVIFNPPKTINKSEINKALSSINREMDEAAEEFYQTNKSDYEL